MSGVDLKSLLPGFVARLSGVRQLLDAIGAETSALDNEARAQSMQLAASTADRRLDLWERELGLPSRADLAANDRRALVLAALGLFGPCTKEGLSDMFARMTGGRVEYNESPGEYSLAMWAGTPGHVVADLPAVARAISRAAPAHIKCCVAATGDMASAPGAPRALHGATELVIYAK